MPHRSSPPVGQTRCKWRKFARVIRKVSTVVDGWRKVWRLLVFILLVTVLVRTRRYNWQLLVAKRRRLLLLLFADCCLLEWSDARKWRGSSTSFAVMHGEKKRRKEKTVESGCSTGDSLTMMVRRGLGIEREKRGRRGGKRDWYFVEGKQNEVFFRILWLLNGKEMM